MGFVYQITNKLNNKMYIGSTTRSVEKRFREHCKPNSTLTLVAKAINKYGKENFEVITLLEVSEEYLLKKECEFINSKNTLVPNGYNLTDNFQHIIVNGEKTKRTASRKMLEAAWKARLGSHHTKETIEIIKYHRKQQKDPRSAPILAIKECFVIPFDSSKEASEFLNIHRNSISNILTGRAKTSRGFSFSYQE